ncbi:unnamed protein product [Mesocestoides corti]|uniref:Uncharacterized protein n=1 Tax=Mesocestoides corti TaxID=53468 RepID=A0A0R3UDY2_MESCO|nr:unnamed protein product [Mesocestoides corti]
MLRQDQCCSPYQPQCRRAGFVFICETGTVGDTTTPLGLDAALADTRGTESLDHEWTAGRLVRHFKSSERTERNLRLLMGASVGITATHRHHNHPKPIKLPTFASDDLLTPAQCQDQINRVYKSGGCLMNYLNY